MNKPTELSSLKETFGYSDDEMKIVNEILEGIFNDDEYIKLKYCFAENGNMSIFRIKMKNDILVITHFGGADKLYFTREFYT